MSLARAVFFISAAYGVVVLAAIRMWGRLDSSEYGPVEALQNAVLATTVAIWLVTCFRWRRRENLGPAESSSVMAAFAVLTFLAMARETSWLKIYGAEAHRIFEAIGAACSIALIGWLTRTWYQAAPNPAARFVAVMRSGPMLLVLCGGLLLLIADGFESGNFLQPASEALEEITELWGYLLFLMAAVHAVRGASP